MKISIKLFPKINLFEEIDFAFIFPFVIIEFNR